MRQRRQWSMWKCFVDSPHVTSFPPANSGQPDYTVREVLPTDPDPAAVAELIEAAKAVSKEFDTYNWGDIPEVKRLRKALERIEGTDDKGS